MDNIGGNDKAEAGMQAPDRSSVLHVHLLGVPRFDVDGMPVVFRSRKAEGLLARLCLSPGGRLSRETAANLFWEDSSDHHARSSLRQTLLILRRILETAGFDGLGGDKLHITLDLDRVRTDIQDLFSADGKVPRRLIDEKRLSERLVEGGEMLSEPFTAWLRVRRQQFHDQLRGVLEPRIALDGEDWHAIEEAEHKGVAFDVFQEVTNGRAYWVRVRTMTIVTVLFLAHMKRLFSVLLADAGRGGSAASWLRLNWLLWGNPGLFRKMMLKWAAYFRPGFHPWDRDNRARMRAAENALALELE